MAIEKVKCPKNFIRFLFLHCRINIQFVSTLTRCLDDVVAGQSHRNDGNSHQRECKLHGEQLTYF